MNIKYRIKNFESKGDIFPYLEELIKSMRENREKFFEAKGDIFPYLEELIKSMRENREKLKDSNNEEEIFKKELDYKMYINYSIFRYKTHIKFSEIVDEKKCFIFFDLIDDSLNSLKELITKENKINIDLRKKLIYENILNIYIQFCFLEYNKKNFEEKKINFLDMFLLILKGGNNNNNNEQNLGNNIPYINEEIIIFCLQIIVQFFNYNDKSQETLNQYLSNNNMLKYLLELKFNKICFCKYQSN